MQIVAADTQLGTSVCVMALTPNGAAHTSGDIQEDDILLEVNGVPVSGMLPDEVLEKLSLYDTPPSSPQTDADGHEITRETALITFRIFRPTALPRRIFSVAREGRAPLGIKMVARSGAYDIEAVAEGSIADAAGIVKGDRLVAVNGHKLFGKTDPEVREMLNFDKLALEIRSARFDDN